MPLLRTISTSLLSRAAARRAARFIPNPLLRWVLVGAATRYGPVVAAKAKARWQLRQAARAGLKSRQKELNPGLA